MTDHIETLEVSSSELEIIAKALETQTKILRMQVSAGGQDAKVKLNAVSRLLSTLERQRAPSTCTRTNKSNFWGLLRSMGHAI
ncbi:MAG: hypothetical protein ABJJ53_18770 [Sulfitobacter sp.]